VPNKHIRMIYKGSCDNNFSHYNCFYSVFDQINPALSKRQIFVVVAE